MRRPPTISRNPTNNPESRGSACWLTIVKPRLRNINAEPAALRDTEPVVTVGSGGMLRRGIARGPFQQLTERGRSCQPHLNSGLSTSIRHLPWNPASRSACVVWRDAAMRSTVATSMSRHPTSIRTRAGNSKSESSCVCLVLNWSVPRHPQTRQLMRMSMSRSAMHSMQSSGNWTNGRNDYVARSRRTEPYGRKLAREDEK